MIRRLWRDESGMALGLAVILVVLIGVMAAGLLTALRADLEGVILTNHGQNALHLADAGAQAAAAQLRADPNPEHYDADPAGNTAWALVPPDGGPAGETVTLDPHTATATILYLLPAKEDDLVASEDYAPERVPGGLTDYPDGDFFLIVSESSVGGTRRKVEVIARTTVAGDGREVEQWSWREVHE